MDIATFFCQKVTHKFPVLFPCWQRARMVKGIILWQITMFITQKTRGIYAHIFMCFLISGYLWDDIEYFASFSLRSLQKKCFYYYLLK